MELEHKTIATSFEVKDEGIVTHLISLYGNVDGGGDVAHAGMFNDTDLSDVVVVDNHGRGSVLKSVGIPLKIYDIGREDLPKEVQEKFPEATGGCMAETQFLLDTPEGQGAFTRLKAGATKKFSFAYNVPEGGATYERKGDRRIRHLNKVNLAEYGPVLFAMNTGAVAVGTKSNEPDFEVRELEGVTEVILEKSDEDRRVSIVGSRASGLRALITRKKPLRLFFDSAKWLPEQISEYLEKQDFNLTNRISEVSRAFYKLQFEGYYFIEVVYDDSVIISNTENTYLYRVPYTIEEGKVTFEDPASWQKGRLEWVPLAANDDDDSAEEEGTKAEEEVEVGEKSLDFNLLSLEVDIELTSLATIDL